MLGDKERCNWADRPGVLKVIALPGCHFKLIPK